MMKFGEAEGEEGSGSWAKSRSVMLSRRSARFSGRRVFIYLDIFHHAAVSNIPSRR
jgi:hypothetical protein